MGPTQHLTALQEVPEEEGRRPHINLQIHLVVQDPKVVMGDEVQPTHKQLYGMVAVVVVVLVVQGGLLQPLVIVVVVQVDRGIHGLMA
jgi:hypothetical protein